MDEGQSLVVRTPAVCVATGRATKPVPFLHNVYYLKVVCPLYQSPMGYGLVKSLFEMRG